MPKRRKKDQVQCQHYRWLLGQRDGVYFADGRSGNDTDLGRHSLNTRELDEAMRRLKELDQRCAVSAGKAPAPSPTSAAGGPVPPLDLDVGRESYMKYVQRPAPLGGVKPKTVQRYKAIFDKFIPYCRTRGVRHWNAVEPRTLEEYATHLDDEEYAAHTLSTEVVTIKQTVKWLADRGLLPQENYLRVKQVTADRPETTNRYCWHREEVEAMLAHCFADPALRWLGYVLLGLATTGLRISELADLRWSDLDLESGILKLPDRRLHVAKSKRLQARSTKGGRDRTIPISDELRGPLEELRAKPHADGRVFRAACGGKLDPDKVRKALIRDVQTPLAVRFPKADGEVGFVDGVPHSFRHYFVSAAANRGVPERVAQDWLGHRASKLIAWYYHLHSEQSKAQMKKLTDIAGGADAAWRRSFPQNQLQGSSPEQDNGPEKT